MSAKCMTQALDVLKPMLKEGERGLKDQVKVLIGGAPVTRSFVEGIEADGFASDAGSASKFAKELLN